MAILTDSEVKESWGKVIKGIAAVTPLSLSEQHTLEQQIEALGSKELALASMPRGMSRSDHTEALRQKYRAAFCLACLCKANGKPADPVAETSMDNESGLDASIKKMLKTALGLDQPVLQKPVTTTSSTVTVTSKPPKPSPPREYSALSKKLWHRINDKLQANQRASLQPQARQSLVMAKVVKAFVAEGKQRPVTVKAMQGMVLEDQHVRTFVAGKWDAAVDEIYREVDRVEKKVLLNFASMLSAVDEAYKRFDATVTRGNEATAAKVALAKSFFEALKKAPPPLSLVGSVGGAIVGVLHVDTRIDPTVKYEALKGDKADDFKNRVVDGLSGIAKWGEEKTRVGISLNDMKTTGSLKEELHKVVATQFEEIGRVVRLVCEEEFGKAGQRTVKARAFLDEVARNKVTASGWYGKASVEQVQLHAEREVEARRKHVCMMIEDLLTTTSPEIVDFNDMVGALEMLLYGSYVEAALKGEGGSYNLKPDIPDKVLERLEAGQRKDGKTEEWSVIVRKATKEGASQRSRLKYDGDANHKRALLYFFEFYRKNLNPFYMVAGTLMDGEVVTPALMKKKKKKYIDDLNKAILANAAKAHFYSTSTTWHWDRIDVAIGRAESLESLNEQLSDLRAHANFHALNN